MKRIAEKNEKSYIRPTNVLAQRISLRLFNIPGNLKQTHIHSPPHFVLRSYFVVYFVKK